MRVWRETEIYGKSAFVILLDTKGCFWRSCYMCGYNNDAREGGAVLAQVERAMEQYDGEEVIKMFTSGSFLDTREISREDRREVLRMLPNVDLTIESRPEFVTDSALDDLGGRRVEVAMGLESASDEVLHNCVNKGFSPSDFVRASRRIRDAGLRVKAYLLLKPPFLSELEALEDLKRSIDFCSVYADVVSINPVNVQKGTLVEALWLEGRYRPPWLWSLVDALLYSQRYLDNMVITSMPTGGGSRRGTHNCFSCGRGVLKAIDGCRIDQDYAPLEDLRCDCMDKWRDSLDLESRIYGNPLYE